MTTSHTRFAFRGILGLACAVTGIWFFVLIAFRAEEISTELRLIREQVAALRNDQTSPPAAAQAARPMDSVAELAGPLETRAAYTLGRADAPLTIVEFTDLQCPFCSRFTSETFEELKRRYIDAGTVRFITKDFPLMEIHGSAKRAAIASRCAGEQGRFWEFRTAIAKQASEFSERLIEDTSRALELDQSRFARCLASPRYGTEVDRDIAEGRDAGVTGTPTFVLGRATSSGLKGPRIVGAQDISVFEAHITALLEKR